MTEFFSTMLALTGAKPVAVKHVNTHDAVAYGLWFEVTDHVWLYLHGEEREELQEREYPSLAEAMQRVFDDNAGWCVLDWCNDELPPPIEVVLGARLLVLLGGTSTQEEALAWLTQGSEASASEGNALLAKLGGLRDHLPSINMPKLADVTDRFRKS